VDVQSCFFRRILPWIYALWLAMNVLNYERKACPYGRMHQKKTSLTVHHVLFAI
jgi:hypothetical protein